MIGEGILMSEKTPQNLVSKILEKVTIQFVTAVLAFVVLAVLFLFRESIAGMVCPQLDSILGADGVFECVYFLELKFFPS